MNLSLQGITLIFALATFLISGGSLLSLFMILPDEFQRRVTSKDRLGLGIAAIGLLLGMLCAMFATHFFTPQLGVYDLSSYFAQLLAMFAGAMTFLGIVIALPDEITEPFLEQKNVKWLLIVFAVLMIIGAILL